MNSEDTRERELEEAILLLDATGQIPVPPMNGDDGLDIIHHIMAITNCISHFVVSSWITVKA